MTQQIYHVKAVQDATSQDLDLNRAADEQFPPEKLRMTIERFYTSVVVGLTEFVRHVGRLRSWREPGRTFAFTLVSSLRVLFGGLLIVNRFIFFHGTWIYWSRPC